MDEVQNWYGWKEHVDGRLDELMVWKEKRDHDLEMANLRMQRLLDAALQRIGELETDVIKTQEENAYLEARKKNAVA